MFCLTSLTAARYEIYERFHRTILNEFYQIMFRRRIYQALDELQIDLLLAEYDNVRTHQGKMWQSADHRYALGRMLAILCPEFEELRTLKYLLGFIKKTCNP